MRIPGPLTPSHLAAFVAGGVFATVVFAHAAPRSSKRVDRYAALDTFAQALSYISNSYVDPVKERKLIYGAIAGMVDKLDAPSTFLTPKRYKRLRQDTEGEFGGVGLILDHGEGKAAKLNSPVVAQVVPKSPSARAGIAVGDRVLAIDGKPTARKGKRISAESWHSRLRGRSGTRVTLLVNRAGWSAPRELVLVRQRIKVPTVESIPVEPGIGYIAIDKFQEATASDVTRALRRLQRDSLSALILDLRDNPGGILDQAIRVADLFLSEGTIVTIRGRRGKRVEREVAHRPGTWTDVRILVLIDQGSASAAEILAGALQDHGRATVMGLPSYGKGSVQTFLDLTDGSGLKLTTARYFTPRGKTLEGAGIKPDIHVEAFAAEVIVAGSPDPAPREDQTRSDHEDTSAVHSNEPGSFKDRLADDHQLQQAYQTVRGWLGSKHAPAK